MATKKPEIADEALSKEDLIKATTAQAVGTAVVVGGVSVSRLRKIDKKSLEKLGPKLVGVVFDPATGVLMHSPDNMR
jgi:hypothetical protein